MVGNEKCPHIDEKSGISDYQKLGRYRSKPMISWNKKRKFDKKREYLQFIHNDGTIHNLGKFRDFRLNQMKGSSFQDFFKDTIELQERSNEIARMFEIIAEIGITKDETKRERNKNLRNGMKDYAVILVKMFRAGQLIKDLIDHMVQKRKTTTRINDTRVKRNYQFLAESTNIIRE